ncbi:hypothetical protein CERZMDRAFT_101170 [Cercospora zeae-maydis SCOH1-5]|uniref:Uncharacterized protein n=1 Tax=Cercospora zeae-maydis SCOH1-5 TaxID=717836 RepID=A0A6A6F846_9PEZI|nr:hypothetical protein CERZMDRAFT_101170 [Cercospora zeae-maydis SCOH1-5]
MTTALRGPQLDASKLKWHFSRGALRAQRFRACRFPPIPAHRRSMGGNQFCEISRIPTCKQIKVPHREFMQQMVLAIPRRPLDAERIIAARQTPHNLEHIGTECRARSTLSATKHIQTLGD